MKWKVSVTKIYPFEMDDFHVVRIPGLAEDNLGEYLKISRRNLPSEICCSTGIRDTD